MDKFISMSLVYYFFGFGMLCTLFLTVIGFGNYPSVQSIISHVAVCCYLPMYTIRKQVDRVKRLVHTCWDCYTRAVAAIF